MVQCPGSQLPLLVYYLYRRGVLATEFEFALADGTAAEEYRNIPAHLVQAYPGKTVEEKRFEYYYDERTESLDTIAQGFLTLSFALEYGVGVAEVRSTIRSHVARHDSCRASYWYAIDALAKGEREFHRERLQDARDRLARFQERLPSLIGPLQVDQAVYRHRMELGIPLGARAARINAACLAISR